MTDNPFTRSRGRFGGGGGRTMFILGGVLLAAAVGCMIGVTQLFVQAGNNVEPGAPGLIPGQSAVFGPVAVLLGVGLVSFMSSIFSFMIGAKRLSRSARERFDDEASRAAA